jgi:RES domain-containing protein
VIAWRIAKRYRASNAAEMMSGDGALRVGGRWNSKGMRAVYAASSLSLAALEVLVHVPNPRVLRDYVMLRLDVPDDFIVDYKWSSVDAEAMKARGDRFITRQEGVALRVASVVIPLEQTLVINPLHPEFKRVKWGRLLPFEFDQRLV